jgi:hypothetical protein
MTHKFLKTLGLTVAASTLAAAPLLAQDDAFMAKYPDFACDVDKGPLSDAEKAQFGDTNFLMKLGKQPDGQEQIDRIYARSTAGAMPKGFYKGQIIPAKSDQGEIVKKYLIGMGLPAALAEDGTVKFLGEALWKGKVFKQDPTEAPNAPSRILANKMPATAVQTFVDALHMPMPDMTGQNEWRFPAKVFCGQSLFDSRRESIIIDYAHSESVVDPDTNEATKIKYVQAVDQIADRKYLQVRDEVRMVRPGYYLGRAYMGRVFILNFTLECVDGDCRKEEAQECDVGAQRQVASNASCMSIRDFRNL